MAIKKSIKLRKAYIEVASDMNHRLVFDALEVWVVATNEKLNEKAAIANQVELERMQELQIFEQQQAEKERLITSANNYYLLNLCKRAFEALEINRLPRKQSMKKLVVRYNNEQLKTKALTTWKNFLSSRQTSKYGSKVILLKRKMKYLKCWITLFNEVSLSKHLHTPFVNLQKEVADENWSLQKLNYNTEKVYHCLSYGKKKHTFMAWKAWLGKLKLLRHNTKIAEANKEKRLTRKYFTLLVNIQYERRQNALVEAYQVSIFS